MALFVLVGLLVLAGCGNVVGPTVGSGAASSEQRPVSGITALELSAPGTVEITTGDVQALTVEAPADVLPRLTSEVSGGVLTLNTKEGTHLQGGVEIRYRLTVPTLDRIAVAGSGSVRYPQLRTGALAVTIDGSGDLTLGGSADRQEVTISGSGTYTAGDLASRTTTLTINGSGDADVAAAERLQATINGSGTVTYRGTPTVEQNIAGSGEVRPA